MNKDRIAKTELAIEPPPHSVDPCGVRIKVFYDVSKETQTVWTEGDRDMSKQRKNAERQHSTSRKLTYRNYLVASMCYKYM